MLNVTDAVQAALNDYETVLYTTMQIQWPGAAGGTAYLTDNPYDITFGGNTYSADGGLMGFSLPKADSIITRDLFFVELADNDYVYKRRLEVTPTGVPISVRLHFVNPENDSDIGNFVFYRGSSSSSSFREDGGGLVTRIEFAGDLFKLDNSKPRFTTADSQRAVSSNDSSMDQVAQPDGELTLRWGKA